MEKIRFPWDTAPGPGTCQEVAEGILWIRLPLPFVLDHINVYALEDAGGWTIIDSGIHSRRGRNIWADLHAGPLQGKPIRRVILTHHHPDHVGAAGWLAREYGAEIWATRTAWLMARMLVLDVQEEYPPESIRFYERAGMRADLLEARIKERPFNFADMVAPIPLGYTRIKDGDSITIGRRVWDVRVGNGHAPEHATLWSRDGDVVVSGDQIIPGISSNLGVYPTEPDADPVGEWFESCTRLLTQAHGPELVLPGHKLPFTGIKARLDQLIENHHSALARLMEHLDTPTTAAECFVPLFGREIEGSSYGLALVESVGHLNHLLKEGQVKREIREKDGAYVWSKR